MNTTKSLVPGLGKLAFSIFLVSAICAHAVDRQVLPGHVLPARTRMQPVGRLASTNHLELTIGLPLRDLQALTNLLQKLYDPTPEGPSGNRPFRSYKEDRLHRLGAKRHLLRE